MPLASSLSCSFVMWDGDACGCSAMSGDRALTSLLMSRDDSEDHSCFDFLRKWRIYRSQLTLL